MGFTLVVILIGILLTSIICATIGAMIMDNKGRSLVSGAVPGFLLGIFGLIICLAMDETVARTARRQAEAEQYNRARRRSPMEPGRLLRLDHNKFDEDAPVARWLSQPRPRSHTSTSPLSREPSVAQTPDPQSPNTGESPEDSNSPTMHNTDRKSGSQDQPSRAVERLSDIELDALLTELLNERKRREPHAPPSDQPAATAALE